MRVRQVGRRAVGVEDFVVHVFAQGQRVLNSHLVQACIRSTKPTPQILEALLPAKDNYAHSEERRLFYVALTRAKHKVYIIADDNNRSCFVDELINEHKIEVFELKNKAVAKEVTQA